MSRDTSITHMRTIKKYETHCHTSPVSKCGRAAVEDTVNFYKKFGYDGIFITNHFLDGNINPEARELPYREQIDYYFSDYEEAVRIGNEIADIYADKYELLKTAGSDNHWGKDIFSRLRENGFRPVIAGMCCETELECVEDYIASVQNGTM